MERGQQASHHRGGIGHSASEEAAMKIAGRPADNKLHRGNPTQCIGESWLVAGSHPSIRDSDKITGEFFPML